MTGLINDIDVAKNKLLGLNGESPISTFQGLLDWANQLDASGKKQSGAVIETLYLYSNDIFDGDVSIGMRKKALDLALVDPNGASIADSFFNDAFNGLRNEIALKAQEIIDNDPAAQGWTVHEIINGKENSGGGLWNIGSRNFIEHSLDAKYIKTLSPFAELNSALMWDEIPAALNKTSIVTINDFDKSLITTGGELDFIKQSSAIYLLEQTQSGNIGPHVASTMLADTRFTDTSGLHGAIINNTIFKNAYFSAVDGIKDFGKFLLPVGAAFTVYQIFEAESALAAGNTALAQQIYTDLIEDYLGEAAGTMFAVGLAAGVAGGITALPAVAALAIGILGAYWGPDFLEWVGETVTNIYNEPLAGLEQLVDDVSDFVVDSVEALAGGITTALHPLISELANIFANLMLEKFFDPVVLDMDGDGIELINVAFSDAQFDFDKDGFNEKGGWVAPDDAFLVFDENGNGVIDDIDEMFGNETISGFDELAAFDLNNDNLINSSDIDPDPNDSISVNDFYDLQIWHDLDGDGVTDAGELQSLTDAGITQIDITGIEVTQESKGNMITELSTWKDDQNNTFTAADVDFQLEQVNSIPQPDLTGLDLIIEAVRAPWSRGYGDVLPLQYEMVTNTTLLDKVQLLDELAPEDFDQAYTLVEEILYEWAGTTAVSTTSRGAEWDGRKLATIEAFTGEDFTNAFNNGSDPLPGSKPFLDAIWDNLLNLFQERLIVQGPMKELFPNGIYDFATDSLDLGDDSGTLISNAMSIETNRDRADYWFKFLDIVIEHDLKERDKIWEDFGMTQEEWDDLLEDRDVNTAALCVSGQDCTAPSPWNTYRTEFKADFAALITDKLGFDLTDIDNDGVLEQQSWILIRDEDIPIVSVNGSTEISAEAVYHGPPGTIEDTNDVILGGKNNDLIRGYGGNDVLYAGTGADFLYSGDGFNFMFGGAGADVLQSGDDAVDVLYGNDGTDFFYLNGDDHTVDGGKGDDSIHLDSEAYATYLWGMNDGNDQIVNSGSSGVGFDQKLVILDDLTPDEIRLNAYGNKLTITNDLTDETFTVIGFVEELDEVHFSDGTVFDILNGTTFRAHATLATYVDGWIGNDTMVSGAGDDTLDGNGGNDVFIHDVGDGNDVLWSGDVANTDVVEMNGVDSVNLYFNAVGNDLIATDVVNDESVTLKHQYYNTAAGYDFDTLSTHDHVFDLTGGLTFQGASATEGEVIRGTAFADTMDGGAGDDMLYGLAGVDLFRFDAGDGEDHLYAGGVNDLDVVTINGALASDIYYNVSSNGRDLIVTNVATGDKLTLDDQFYNTTSGYEFTTVNGEDIKTGLTIQGTSDTAGEYVYGSLHADTLDAGLGNDIVYGQGGNDTFEHNVGDGDDRLYAGGVNDLDIVLMNGVAANDLYFNVSNNDLIVTNADNGEQLTLHLQFYQTASGYDFASVNGVDITGGLTIKGESATAGEFIYGTANNDTMIGGAGNDIIYGKGGTDTYTHNVGDGNDHLYAGGYDDGDIVLMNGVAANDLYFNKSSNDLVVTDNATGEKVTLDNHFHNTAGGYEFDTVNGIDVTGALHIRGSGNLYGTTHNDTLEGGGATNIYYSGDGDDQLIAAGGGDWLYGQNGADTFVFTDITHSTTSSKTKIKDFVSGTDLIDLSAITTIDELSDLTLTENYGRTYVDDNNSNFYFEIEGSGATGLDASDFIFT